ncbi:MAG TPA: NAD(P)H-binding protein [Candidatus Binatia bacterium]|nr:NAD(P)H-binding protein [Candidatus Binatia bacterium]
MPAPFDILVTGGTGYIGTHLVPKLLGRGHRVRILARADSITRVSGGATPVPGNPLDVQSVQAALRQDETVIHLVGTPHPNPSKAEQFEKVDLVSIKATVTAAKNVGIRHLIYVSVAQPAPVMRAFLWVRTLGETMIGEAGLTATIVRPWYVLGPGHRWPTLLKPLYKFAELVPATRATAERLGLVTIDEMVAALVRAVEQPPLPGQRRLVEVPDIKRALVQK